MFLILDNYVFVLFFVNRKFYVLQLKKKKNWKGSGEEGRDVGLDWGKGNGYVYSRGNLLILNDFVE